MAQVTTDHGQDDLAQQQAPEEDWNAPPYNSDDFRMYGLKVQLCQKTHQHNISACPYAHPGERAVRRDVRLFKYDAVVCQELLQKGKCPREDNCKAAHSVFEYWLHPSRYRTQLCREGSSCTRRVCFFAHSLAELRPTSGPADATSSTGPMDPFSCGGKYSLAALSKKQQRQQQQGDADQSGSSSGTADQQATSSSAGSPRRKSAESAAPKHQGQSRSRRSSSEAVAPPAAATAATAWSPAAAVPSPAHKGFGNFGHNSASPACVNMLPPRMCFNIQASSSVNNGCPLQNHTQQQQHLVPLAAEELYAACCDSASIPGISCHLNNYSNSSIGSGSVASSGCNSNSLSPQLLQQVSLDSCFSGGSPAAALAMAAASSGMCSATPASQQLLLLLGQQCNQAAACNSSSCVPLQQANSNLAEQLLCCSEPMPWACDLSPRQAGRQLPLRTLSPQQQQMLQVLLPAAADTGLAGTCSPVSQQVVSSCSPQLLSGALASLDLGSPATSPPVTIVSCDPACQQQLLQLMVLPNAPLQQQQCVVGPPAAESCGFAAQASAMSQQACLLAQQATSSMQQQQVFMPSPCMPVNASFLQAASSPGFGTDLRSVPAAGAAFDGPFVGSQLQQQQIAMMAVPAWM